MDVMQQKLSEHGYRIVPFDGSADIYIINTCTVTNIADRKSRQMLHRAKKENPQAVVVAVGCYVETDHAGVERDACIDIAVGNNRKSRIVEILDDFFRERELGNKVDKTLGGEAADDMAHIEVYEQMRLEHQPGHTRAYIKIQDGCNQFCSYCIIPYARGRIRSRQEKDILEEVRGLVSEGCREVVLTGIHISSYGLDRGQSELLQLICAIHDIDGVERIRLGSLEPRIITPQMAAAFGKLPKLCPHFHLSLQSGCDATLQRMNRHYSAAEYAEGVRLLREVYDRPAITTDVIVGFPGETAEEFEESHQFIKNMDFYEIHVFKYSVRKGTVAEKLPGQLTDHQKSERSDVLLELTAGQSQKYRRSFIGERVKVLWEDTEETEGKKYLVGHTERYVRVALPAEMEDAQTHNGKISTVMVQKFLNEDTLLGTIC
jgi:threonylcarbamoyladenosine tRNA methylthiotransferase MtaB